jgi:hypothetical protein
MVATEDGTVGEVVEVTNVSTAVRVIEGPLRGQVIHCNPSRLAQVKPARREGE